MSSEKVLQSILGTFAEIGEHVFDNRYVDFKTTAERKSCEIIERYSFLIHEKSLDVERLRD